MWLLQCVISVIRWLMTATWCGAYLLFVHLESDKMRSSLRATIYLLSACPNEISLSLLLPFSRTSGSEFDRREKSYCVARLLAAFRSPCSSVWSEMRTHSPGQCVISADKNITQATPPKVVPWGGDDGGDGGGMEIFRRPVSRNRPRNRYHSARPLSLALFLSFSHSLAPGQIIPCDLPQPQRN